MSIIPDDPLGWLVAVIFMVMLLVALYHPGPPPPPMVPVAQPFCAPAGVSVLNDAGNPWTFCGDNPDIQMRNT